MGLKTQSKLVIFLSDDWGTCRIRSKQDQQDLNSKGLKISNRFDQYDALETNKDLELLFDVLTQHKDKNGIHPVITAVTNVANPDFDRIQESDFEYYNYKTVDHCYRDTPDSDRVLGLVQQGIDQRIFIPQSHGREHLQWGWWINELRVSSSPARKYFDNGYFFVRSDDCEFSYSQRGLGAAFDVYHASDIENHKYTIKSALDIFEDLYGYRSTIFTPPAMVYHPALESAMVEGGVEWLDVGRFLKIPQVGGGKRFQLNYLGRKIRSGLKILVRNAVFEPNMSLHSDGLDSCLAQIEQAFKAKQPAIISNHRAAFTGRIDPKNRGKGLQALDELLGRILKTWPDVSFISAQEVSTLSHK